MRGHYISVKLAASRKSPLVQSPKKTPRTCLCCGRTFASDGPGNRICDRCPPRDKLG